MKSSQQSVIQPLRVIQFGTGPMVHAAPVAQALRNLPEYYQLEAIIEENDELKANAKKNPVYDGIPFITWEEALAYDPDAFIVETEEHSLVAAAIRCLEAGYPVYMDKPGSEDCEQFHYMCDLAKKKGLVLSLGYMFRHNPAVKYAHELADSGKLGEILNIETQMSVSSGTEYRKTLSRFGGGMMYYLGCHMIDLIVSFCGFPDEVIPMNTRSNMDGVDCVDQGFCVYKYKRGLAFVKSNATEINSAFRRSVVISGTKGTFEIRPMEIYLDSLDTVETLAWETLDNEEPWKDHRKEVKFDPVRRYDELLISFYRYVTGNEKNPYTYDYEAKLHDLIMKSC